MPTRLLRVCSMWQPWATLCVAPLPATGKPPKQHETRAFAPRGPLPLHVAIHATKKWDSNNVWTATEFHFSEALRACGFLTGPTTKRGVFAEPGLKPLPLGCIIGVATIVEVKPTASLFPAEQVTHYDYEFGDWNPGRYAWRFEDALLLPEPIPFKGRQDVLYILDPAVQAQIYAQLVTA
jgi:hypothetical protein